MIVSVSMLTVITGDQMSQEESLFPSIKKPKTFKVVCGVMKTTAGVEFWVNIESSDRPKDASIFDEVGRRNVFVTDVCYNAVLEARDWAELLDAEVDLSIFIEYLDKKYLRCDSCHLSSCTCGMKDYKII